jgi:hypothetical protein
MIKRPILTPSLQCSNWTRPVERYSIQLPAIAVGLHRMEYGRPDRAESSRYSRLPEIS